MKWYVLLLILFLSLKLFGQNGYNLPPKANYKEAIIGLKTFEKVNARNLIISSDSLSLEGNCKVCSYSLEDVNYIRVQEGRKTKKGIISGVISALVVSAIGIVRVLTSSELELNDDIVGVVLFYVVGGTLIGAVIGSIYPRYVTYYLHART
jgi:hypothetical protein